MTTQPTMAPTTHERTNDMLQALVDAAAAKGGGTVEVPAGTYLMHDALHLRSNVRIVGQGMVVLKKVASVSSPLLDFLGYGHYEFRVAEPAKFRVGMGVHVLDKNAGGFYTTVGTITRRRGDLFFINRPFSHDYHADAEGRVVSAFSLIEGEGVSDASVENITLDGNSGEETFQLNGCRGGGLFLIKCHRVGLRGLEVRHYRGDAVSFQQCSDIVVDDCHVHHNVGGGLHPGSGSVRYLLRNNHVHDNGGCGIFYCLRTTHSICEKNHIHHNADVGISIGERDTDHLVRENTITDNGGPGVDFRPPHNESGDRVQVTGNTLARNARKFGKAEIVIPAGLGDIHLAGNTITTTPGRVAAIAVEPGCERISAADNRIDGRPQQASDILAMVGSVLLEKPAALPPVGPAALPLDGALHLRIEKLGAWKQP